MFEVSTARESAQSSGFPAPRTPVPSLAASKRKANELAECEPKQILATSLFRFEKNYYYPVCRLPMFLLTVA